jgi:hypothetical protein
VSLTNGTNPMNLSTKWFDPYLNILIQQGLLNDSIKAKDFQEKIAYLAAEEHRKKSLRFSFCGLYDEGFHFFNCTIRLEI